MTRAASIALVCLASHGALAQNANTRRPSPNRAAPCAVNPNDAWVKRQAEWFDESKRDWSNDAWRRALLAAAGLETPLTAPVQIGVRVDSRSPALGATADSMTNELRKLAAVRGSQWPTRSVVGAAGAHAVFLLAARDTAFGRVALHRLMEAGPDESPAADVATLEDQLRLANGRKQLYGTQFENDAAGTIRLRAMEDSSHADLRREGAGLPPFALGLCLAKTQR
jgi:hypothetical protein